MKGLSLIYVVAQALAAAGSVPVALWPQVGAVPPGTAGAQAQGTPANPDARPIVLAPGITVPAGRPGIVPVPRPQTAAGTAGGAAQGSTAGPAAPPPAPAPSQPGSIITSPAAAASSAALEPLPSPAAAAHAVGGCTVLLSASRLDVRSGGNFVEVRMQPVPEGCSPAVASRAEWAQRLTTEDPSTLRLSVTANPSRESRLATVQVGDKVLVLEQAGAEAPAISVVPGKLAFGMQPKKMLPQSRRIAIDVEDPQAVVTVTPTAPWVIATPVKGKAREYDVRVDAAAVPPGRLRDAAVRVSSGAAVVDVPVVVERPQLR